MPGDEAHHLNAPTGVCVDPDGLVYVVDSGNHRVQVFTKTGAYVRTIGTGEQGDGNDQFDQPERVTIDPGEGGRVYVADADLVDCSYHKGLPGELRTYFGLPRFRRPADSEEELSR